MTEKETSTPIAKDTPAETAEGQRGPRTNNRLFLDALLWMARSGGRWRDLPERLGDYRSVKRRYYRWIEMGVLDEMLSDANFMGLVKLAAIAIWLK